MHLINLNLMNFLMNFLSCDKEKLGYIKTTKSAKLKRF